jgi:dihydroceramidase
MIALLKVWGIWLRHCLNGRQDEYELVWPGLFTSLPRVDRRKDFVVRKTR